MGCRRKTCISYLLAGVVLDVCSVHLIYSAVQLWSFCLKISVKVTVSYWSHHVLLHQDICFLLCSLVFVWWNQESQHLISRFTVVTALDDELFSYHAAAFFISLGSFWFEVYFVRYQNRYSNLHFLLVYLPFLDPQSVGVFGSEHSSSGDSRWWISCKHLQLLCISLWC